ncbi:MAG: NosD domain-containing protein [Elusimicrobiota bacterium]
MTKSLRTARTAAAVLLASLWTSAASAFAETLHVPADYATIQTAIDAARQHDTVLVAPGTYTESITLKPDVAVRGSGAQRTTIRSDGTLRDYWKRTCAVIGANGGAISGFTITGGETAVYMWGHSPVITRNVIEGSVAGIAMLFAAPTIADNIITGAQARGIYGWQSPAKIVNNVITGSAAGIANARSAPAIANNIIAGNAIGILNEDSSPIIGFNDLWDNETNIDDRDSSFPKLGANIFEDPLFENPAKGDYRLRTGSPCIDAGTNGAPGIQKLDFDGYARVFDGDGDFTAKADMGAFERFGEASPSFGDLLPGFREGEKNGWR